MQFEAGNSRGLGVSANDLRLTALYSEHGLRLRRYVFAILRDREAADDVVQTTFAKAVESAGDVAPAALKSWLYRTAYNEAIDVRRRSAVDRRATERMAVDDGRQTGDPLVAAETIERVRRAMQELNASQQHVVRARMYDDKKFTEIAAELHSPIATVITQMRRALEKLRRTLDRDESPDKSK